MWDYNKKIVTFLHNVYKCTCHFQSNIISEHLVCSILLSFYWGPYFFRKIIYQIIIISTWLPSCARFVSSKSLAFPNDFFFQLVSQAAKAIKSWSSNFEPTMDGHVISVPVPRYNIKIILISFFNMVLLTLRHRSAHHTLFSTLNVWLVFHWEDGGVNSSRLHCFVLLA